MLLRLLRLTVQISVDGSQTSESILRLRKDQRKPKVKNTFHSKCTLAPIQLVRAKLSNVQTGKHERNIIIKKYNYFEKKKPIIHCLSQPVFK